MRTSQQVDGVSETAEAERLSAACERTANWKRWGPYLAERQWGTVREDYSPDGACWDYFSHDQARSRAYRWGEDGLLGIADRECRLCFAPALWNGRDPILKERMFGLTNEEGNHGEDVKEEYFFLDSTPTHSYMKALYKYPQAAFPYERLVEENRRRGFDDPEFELADAGVFEENRYFDVTVEYAKAAPNDLLIRITVTNRGPEEAVLHLLPTLWFRNTWSWGCRHEGCTLKPRMMLAEPDRITLNHPTLGEFALRFETSDGDDSPHVLFTENETNTSRLFGVPLSTPYVKDAFHRAVVRGNQNAVNPKQVGTKAAPHYKMSLKPGESRGIRLRLSGGDAPSAGPLDDEFAKTFAARKREADAFYAQVLPNDLGADARLVARQAYAGLLWSKQFYHYIIEDWLEGDPEMPEPPASRVNGRNAGWKHLYSRDVLSMPDTWEYPWFAAWDLAFHMLPFAHVDADFAKKQLILLLREWYMHPNGQ
ncbi:MAG: glucosidase, partial [Verrucomicrobiota bacterium]